ncbi:hypothetical protein L596_014758 [Steinernema carpocapsae]|nr:hypothetical protein L596_014758 [Steinernema carpocapsae]
MKNPKVRMRDPKAVEDKLVRLIEEGTENMIVFADFDYTLSRYHDGNGIRCSSSHGVFDTAAERTDKQLYEKLHAMNEKYMAIETCHLMSMEEKIPHMIEWWTRSHEKIVESKLHKEVVEEIVQDSKIVMRDRSHELFELLDAKEVPLVIFSAGVGTVIDIYLRQRLPRKELPKNVHIISNMMIFDEENICINFTEPLIHVFCKNGSAVRHDDPFFHDFSERHNVVLMGDSLGDLEMHVGVERSGIVLKIGFLNHKFDTMLDKYLAEGAYDIVILDDQSVDIPLAIFDQVPSVAKANGNGVLKNEEQQKAEDEELPKAFNVPA